MSVSPFRSKVIHLSILLCYSMMHTCAQSLIASFGNEGLCCVSPNNCSISDCGFLNSECCRLNDDYVCSDDLNYTAPTIYEGWFTIPIHDHMTEGESNAYFRLYPDHMYFEYRLPSDRHAIGLSWQHYDHPIPDLHFTIFASETEETEEEDEWSMFDMLARNHTYRIWSTNTQHECNSTTGYCLPDRVLHVNYQTAYNSFDFTRETHSNQSVFVWERKYSVPGGQYQYDGLYESVHNEQSENEICWNYAIFEGNTIGRGGEKIDAMDTICTTAHSICGDSEAPTEERMCAVNKVDLVIILDITLSDNVWIQLQEWIENVIIDIHDTLMAKEQQYAFDILFRVSLIAYCDEYFDLLQTLEDYNWGNRRVLIQNLIYDMDEIIIKHPNRTTTVQLKSALHVATSFVFPKSGADDLLFTLLITDEVVTRDEDKPCLDTHIVDAFNAFDPIFGAVWIDERRDDSLLPLFIESVECLVGNDSDRYSVIETNSSVPPSASFHSLYDFVQRVDINEFNAHPDACDSMINVTWPLVHFDYFVPFDECVGANMDLIFIIDLTPKHEMEDCFSCWMDSISSIIMAGFELVRNVTARTASLHVAIVTFDGMAVHTYYNLNDPALDTYPRLSQIFSLLDSLAPVVDEYDDVMLEDAIAEVYHHVLPHASTHTTLQSLLFIDPDPETLYIANQNTSYGDICHIIDEEDTLYLIHDYRALEHSLFPLYQVECTAPYLVERAANTYVIYGSNHEDEVLNQLYIIMTHRYCPQECHECDLALFDATKDLPSTLFLSNWAMNKPITTGWNITTSEYSFQEIIKSIDVYIYGLETYHQIQVSVYDPVANQYISESIQYPGVNGQSRYTLPLPLTDEYGQYNYLAANHAYSINIELHNISKKDAKSVEMVLQNVSQNMYYEAQSQDHFATMNGLLFIYWERFPFNIAYHAVSTYTPFGTICVVCVGENNTIPLPPTTATPTEIPTIIPSTTPTTEPTDFPSYTPTSIPSNTPTVEPSDIPSETPTTEPTGLPSETPTAEPSVQPTVAPSTTITTSQPPLSSTTSTLIPEPTDRECPAVAFDEFCRWTCNEKTGNYTEWDVEFISYAYDPSTDLTTFNYKASTLASIPEDGCRYFHKKIQSMTIIFLYISTCCELGSDSEHLRNITSLETPHYDSDQDISIWGINGDHWIFYPFRLSPGTSTHFTLTLKGEYIVTKGSFVASHKSWFDGSRPNHRCALDQIAVPDICGMETKSPTSSPIPEPSTTSTLSTDAPSVSPILTTDAPTVATTEDTDDDCPTLPWPDLQEDCEQYCLSSQSEVEWNMAHISTLYNSLSDTTTIAWSVTVESNHWAIRDWCFPVSFNPRFNYPERLKRVLIRLNPCCTGQISSAHLNAIIEGVSDDGDFSIIVDENDMVSGIQWDNIHLKKGKTGMFFVSFNGNMTLIDGDYWFFGGNKHSRCTSDEVRVPDVCASLLINDFAFEEEAMNSNPNEGTDWYLEWLFRIDTLNNNRRRMQSGSLSEIKHWMDSDAHDRFICNDWIRIIGVEREYVKLCNVSIVYQQYTEELLTEFIFKVDIIADQHRLNQTQVIQLKSRFEHNTTERSAAQNLISNDLVSISGVEFTLECNDFVVSEIASRAYYTKREQVSAVNLHTWGGVVSVIAMAMVLALCVVHRYYVKKQTQRRDEPHLIHQIEDLFMEEWYENNRKHSQKHSEIRNEIGIHLSVPDYNDESVCAFGMDVLSPIEEEEGGGMADRDKNEDDEGSSISNLSSNDTDQDDISLEIGWNGEYKL